MKLKSSCPVVAFKLIDHREEIIVIWAGFVEIRKVDTDSLLPVLFLHENGVREPIGIEYFSDEASLE